MTSNDKINVGNFMPDGYRETIQKGIEGVRRFSGKISLGSGELSSLTEKLKNEVEHADAIVIGAGAGLSASAGFTYSGERFNRYFSDFALKFGIRDMYSGGFYPFPNDETRWAWWARHIYFNRYVEAPKPVYNELYNIVNDRNYFVITTNVDSMFLKSGFDDNRLFCTQGDYGLFQCLNPDIKYTVSNEEWVMKAMEAQGFVKDENGVFVVPADGKIEMSLPSDLIPKFDDGKSDVTMNLRVDDSFLEDEKWKKSSAAYSEFLRRNENGHVLYLELGVGSNTPIIIKYPFWEMTYANGKSVYACINLGEALCPQEINERSICIDNDIGAVLHELKCR
ncbi:MAG: hypothetical protein MRZ89_04795 [Lachnospiraceae bacterium]|nr:hypothetical protein [Lachnospiraceae bacterium]